MAEERLLTYAAAAQLMGISEKAFRNREARGAIPKVLLFDRPRGDKMPPERFVYADAFRAWCGPPVEAPIINEETP